MRVLYLPRYGPLGASSRVRGYQYLPWLCAAGLEVTVSPLLPDTYLQRLYAGQGTLLSEMAAAYVRRVAALLQRARHDLVWLEYEALPWLPAGFERLALGGARPYVVDYDDAIFHRYDLHRMGWVRRMLGSKIDRIMQHAALVLCGNDYLGARARQAGAQRVEHLPTVIDLARYPRPKPAAAPEPNPVPVIGWIGSPATTHYLEHVRTALAQVCASGQARLRLVGARDPHWRDVAYEVVPWVLNSEAALLAGFDIGIMPLPDTPWERGKCGYKLIQYMACGKAVLASPVGVNRQIVVPEHNGLLAESMPQWVQALQRLLRDAALRQRMGAAGRSLVEQHYCLQVTAPRLIELLRSVARR
jgi:glycosyltransferase involved in cell wall biosynthesis